MNLTFEDLAKIYEDLAAQYEKLQTRHKKLLEELKRHSEGNSSPIDALNAIAEDEKAK